jgi:glycosyltransferase involved in cell wall biosynthesis
MFSLVIPVYNEELSVARVISDYLQALSVSGHPFEIIVVDDHSTDLSASIARSLPVRLICHEANRGYGHSVKTGISAAIYDNIITTDCDNTYPATLLSTMMEQYLEGGNMTVAARSGPYFNRHFIERAARFLLYSLVEVLVGGSIPDVNSGYRIFDRRLFAPYWDLMSERFSFTTSLTMVASFLQIPIKYVSFTYGKREGRSKIRYGRDTWKAIQRIFNLHYHFRVKGTMEKKNV